MAFMHWSFLLAVGAGVAMGCGSGSGNTGGSGGQATGGSGGSGGQATASTSTSSATTTVVLDPSGFSCSGASPTMADVVAITSKHCSEGLGCHVAMSTGGGVYDQMVNRIAEQCVPEVRLMVEPGNPERSYMIHKMVGLNVCTGQTMPKDQALLPDTDIQVLYDWICVGAPDK
jgi:hypothetical protein